MSSWKTISPAPADRSGTQHGRVQQGWFLLLAGSALFLALVFFLNLRRAGESVAPDPLPEPATQADSSARQYIENLTQRNGWLDARNADSFVTGDQKIYIGAEPGYQEIAAGDLLKQIGMKPDTPITVIREREQVEYRTPSQLLDRYGGNREQKIRILRGGHVVEVTLGTLETEYAGRMDEPLPTVLMVEYPEHLTPGELAEDETVKLVEGKYRKSEMSLSEVFGSRLQGTEDTVFYVRTVEKKDVQGLWGIIHHGLTENFGKGIAIQRGAAQERYQVDIPRTADEREGAASSFLGKLIDDKVQQSFVYNLEQDRMGAGPDTIFPGQELVIIAFTVDELLAIYQHFIEPVPPR